MLKLPDNREYTLQVSYMGYISQTHKVSVSKTGKVDFILKEDAVNMETVVVTGTRTPKLLKDVPIVTRVITADEIKKVDATHIGDLLQAELPRSLAGGYIMPTPRNSAIQVRQVSCVRKQNKVFSYPTT